MLEISIVLFTGFIVLSFLDAWSTNKILKHNHKILHDKKYYERYKKILLEEEAKAELSKPARYFIKRYGSERALFYIVLLLSFPLGLFIFYCLLTNFGFWYPLILLMLGWMAGTLFRQIWIASHLKKNFGFKI